MTDNIIAGQRSIDSGVASEAGRKARGAFFTPPRIADFMAQWAIRQSDERVLEPSCGEAAFLLPLARRFKELGVAPPQTRERIDASDIHEASINVAKDQLDREGFGATLSVEDFFLRESQPHYDAVIGNPPYVRYQAFAGQTRTRAIATALRQGVRLTQLASSWAAFTVHASSFLKPDGRLALVLPAELLTVKYAAEVRRFLLRRFATVRLVLFENLVFPGVLEDVVLLLAEGSGGAKSFEVYPARDANDLASLSAENWIGFAPRGDEKWTSALLPSIAFGLYGRLLKDGGFEQMANWGDTYLGAVTGNNSFFTLTPSAVSELGLSDRELLRISPPGSRHLRGLSFSDRAWKQLTRADERCYLFFPSAAPSRAASKYIADGEKRGVHTAYKCRVRNPWWKVPLATKPHLLFAYMNHDRPRLIRNGSGVHVLNSLYGVRLHTGRISLGADLLALASLNSVTLLGAEIVGRSYGGGMLKHEPTEADVLPLPSLDLLRRAARRLRLVEAQVGALLRQNDITPAIDIVDRIMLIDALRLSDLEIGVLRNAREIFLQRRLTRGRTPGGRT